MRRIVLLAAIAVTSAVVGCCPRARVPTMPLSLAEFLPPGDSGAVLARQLAPTLYLQRDESFQLVRVVAVVHPHRPLIAYHLLWEDDAFGAWLPFTTATDQEIVWVAYDSTSAPSDLWTYWHGTLLHADWRGKGQVVVDVQWGKHGSLPRATDPEDLPRVKSLRAFYALSWLLPDLWLGAFVRPGPLCFCHTYPRYKDFSRPLLLAPRLDAIIRTSSPNVVFEQVFGLRYSRKVEWPGEGESIGQRESQ